ncbi:hypothetical protein Trydic_g23161 [Trypoxylus dichotomus]
MPPSFKTITTGIENMPEAVKAKLRDEVEGWIDHLQGLEGKDTIDEKKACEICIQNLCGPVEVESLGGARYILRLYQPDTKDTIITLDFEASYEPVEMGVTNNNPENQSDNEEIDQSSTESELSPIDRDLDDPDYVNPAIANHMNYPMTLKEALSRPDKREWQKAIQEEYESLLQNNTWELVNLPKEESVIQTKWVFKRKYRETSVRYKARLVIKGCSNAKD